MHYPASAGGYHDSLPAAELPSIRTLHTILNGSAVRAPAGVLQGSFTGILGTSWSSTVQFPELMYVKCSPQNGRMSDAPRSYC